MAESAQAPETQAPMVAPGGEYGSRQDMEQIQSGAAMQGSGGVAADLIPLTAPSMSPNEPLTAGAALGPGIGPDAAGIRSDTDATLDALAPLVPALELAANLADAPASARSYVRALKARLAARD